MALPEPPPFVDRGLQSRVLRRQAPRRSQPRRADPSLEHFFVSSGAEPFFVKNLENIQGDERDVILISVGYGRDDSGYMAMNFGPLSNEGGERRLNVLIARARDCCAVFSSIVANDVELNRARSRGAQALKTFLKYAETGLLDTGMATGRDYNSEFERQVAKALAVHGYQTHPQVGVAGFFIDLAVVDPDAPAASCYSATMVVGDQGDDEVGTFTVEVGGDNATVATEDSRTRKIDFPADTLSRARRYLFCRETARFRKNDACVVFRGGPGISRRNAGRIDRRSEFPAITRNIPPISACLVVTLRPLVGQNMQLTRQIA